MVTQPERATSFFSPSSYNTKWCQVLLGGIFFKFTQIFILTNYGTIGKLFQNSIP
jgi:hypothetical protein